MPRGPRRLLCEHARVCHARMSILSPAGLCDSRDHACVTVGTQDWRGGCTRQQCKSVGCQAAVRGRWPVALQQVCQRLHRLAPFACVAGHGRVVVVASPSGGPPPKRKGCELRTPWARRGLRPQQWHGMRHGMQQRMWHAACAPPPLWHLATQHTVSQRLGSLILFTAGAFPEDFQGKAVLHEEGARTAVKRVVRKRSAGDVGRTRTSTSRQQAQVQCSNANGGPTALRLWRHATDPPRLPRQPTHSWC